MIPPGLLGRPAPTILHHRTRPSDHQPSLHPHPHLPVLLYSTQPRYMQSITPTPLLQPWYDQPSYKRLPCTTCIHIPIFTYFASGCHRALFEIEKIKRAEFEGQSGFIVSLLLTPAHRSYSKISSRQFRMDFRLELAGRTFLVQAFDQHCYCFNQLGLAET